MIRPPIGKLLTAEKGECLVPNLKTRMSANPIVVVGLLTENNCDCQQECPEPYMLIDKPVTKVLREIELN